MRVTFNGNQQLIITTNGVMEKMAVEHWKEKSLCEGGFREDALIFSEYAPRKEPPSTRSEEGTPKGKLLYCSFCGKDQHQVNKLIAGPSVFICDECVDLCCDIINEGIYVAAEKSE